MLRGWIGEVWTEVWRLRVRAGRAKQRDAGRRREEEE